MLEKNRVDLIIDPYLVGKISSRSFKTIRESFTQIHSEQRPTMEEVVAGLELARKKQPTSGSSSRQPNGRTILELKTGS
ncbi:hypothetical protein Leryth_022415 [Lithospermum erythrorhizon]|nr:hypothetical protein Leryth_022415 [Lithospermum erythrorhizon]